MGNTCVKLYMIIVYYVYKKPIIIIEHRSRYKFQMWIPPPHLGWWIFVWFIFSIWYLKTQVHWKPFSEHYVQNLCSSELPIFGDSKFVGTAQVFQLAMKVVEHNTNLVDLHPSFGEQYQDHEFFCHINEATPFQSNALD